jgi:hypothetical protein
MSADDYEKKAQEELEIIKRMRMAYEEEFSSANSASTATDGVRELLPSALSTLAYLLDHAEKESVRATIAKFVVEKNIADSLTKDPGGVEELIAKLSAND